MIKLASWSGIDVGFAFPWGWMLYLSDVNGKFPSHVIFSKGDFIGVFIKWHALVRKRHAIFKFIAGGKP
jgi:hypothetical protein